MTGVQTCALPIYKIKKLKKIRIHREGTETLAQSAVKLGRVFKTDNSPELTKLPDLRTVREKGIPQRCGANSMQAIAEEARSSLEECKFIASSEHKI